MGRRVLEWLRGTGELYADTVLLRRARYELSLWVEEGTSGDVPAHAVNIDGHIDLTGMGEAIVLAGPKDLTLRLQDGRRLAFALTDTGGHIAARGPLQPG